LRTLAIILASTTKPMNPTKQRAEEACLWHGADGNVDLSLRNFPRKEGSPDLPVGTLDSSDARPFVDGVAKRAVVEYFKQQGGGETTATTIAANIAAGCMADITRIFEPAVMTRTAQLCQQTGFQVGSMGNSQHSLTSTRPCETCGKKTMIGWKINDATLSEIPKGRQHMEYLQKQRSNRILHSELDAWREAGLGHKSPRTQKAARQQEASRIAEAKRTADRRRSVEERDARLAARNGLATSPAPVPEEAHDDREGPRQFKDFVRGEIVKAADVLVCLNCAGPTIHKITSHRTQAGKKWSADTALWQELVTIAQGRPPSLTQRKVTEGRWPDDRIDLFRRGRWGELKGQTVRSADGQTGKVVLVNPRAAGAERPTEAYVYWNSEHPTLELTDIDTTHEACKRAKEERVRCAEETLAKAMISIQDIQAVSPGMDLCRSRMRSRPASQYVGTSSLTDRGQRMQSTRSSQQ
jgi:hypothetical protein